jgi:N-methylhydantoinase A
MLAAPPTREVSRTLLVSSEAEGVETRMDEAFDGLRDQAVAEMVAEGNDPDLLEVRSWVDARYRGQSFELRVPREDWVSTFHRSHQERYGYAREGTPVEAVTLRAVAEGPPLTLSHAPLPPAEGPPPAETGKVFSGGREVEVQMVWRKDLRDGHTLPGPALVMEYSSTTWLPPGWILEVDRWGSLHLWKDR